MNFVLLGLVCFWLGKLSQTLIEMRGTGPRLVNFLNWTDLALFVATIVVVAYWIAKGLGFL